MNVSILPCASYEPADVRDALSALEPLFRTAVRPGDRVVLKPNWLAHRHKYRAEEWQSVVTHPAVITGVLRMVLERLAGSGEVVITDGPQTDSSWTGIMRLMTPDLWKSMGREAGSPVSIVDLREHEWTTRGDVNIERRSLPGDPRGSVTVDLAGASEFANHRTSARGYYGADYDVAETNRAHSAGRHEYKLSRTAIAADVVINLPKMKTHKKAGITCSLKNLVGINTYKNYLPHHTEGTPAEGGDQFPSSAASKRVEGAVTDRFKAFLTAHPRLGRAAVPVKYLGKKVFGDTRTTIRSGSWYGNDTLWRMVLDLNKALFYANPDGTMRPDTFENRKRYLTIVDGIVAGDGNGPEAPDPKHCGVLVAGIHPVAVDAVCARLMGFDWQRIPCIRQAFEIQRFPLCDFGYDDVRVVSSDARFNGPIAEIRGWEFRPHFGWTGHVELTLGKAS
jgi:uncharacterized protein (DUF362 family)